MFSLRQEFARSRCIKVRNMMAVANGVIDFMKNHQTVYYCHENGLPR